MMAVLRLAAAMKQKHYTKSAESLDDSKLLQNAIMQIVGPTLTEVECVSLDKLVNKSLPVFATTAAQKEDDKIVQLRLEVKEELNRNKLQVTNYHVDKVRSILAHIS